MDHPIGGGLFPGSSAGILDLQPSTRHRLPPPPAQPMSLFSDDEDAAIAGGGGEDSPSHDSLHRGKKASPWQRMKWTDDVVRLLISLVASIGDDAGSMDTAGRKQSVAMQKKGKWKMVSKLMMQKGCYVSPQQCEDKFNDLNKRYKRLNEILGRGTTCQVVENPALLDSMPHVSQKAKDDVRRILSSKHLFYREMCAYHNGQRVLDSKVGFFKCGDAHEVEDEDEENEEEKEEDDEDEDDGCGSDDFGKVGYDKLCAEIDLVVQDSTKTLCERRVWIRKRLLLLQQERVGIQSEAFELEKRRMKWKRFCSKKDRELESLRMKNERIRLENERMSLQVRHKELELDSMRSAEMVEPFVTQVEGERVRAHSGVGRLQTQWRKRIHVADPT
ncbi:hypothetical protein IEQ34_013620 [Dendrobium chrysotoxum]|uniref:Myb/SANT-like DNA-binding domain-containing protein n=1 Tax=Dendrobium chrysotoxum TaxID=161865 RepID=A0AAV7GPY5_DENCH|nr:hypothetical protein IEQ34_013620 [Dendrobium chrysotoxum]